MRCQKCKAQEATAHISGTKTTRLRTGGELSSDEFTLHFCAQCADEYQRTQRSQSMFPELHEEQITERVRVVAITPDSTVLRLIRTEAQPTPEDWSLLTSRVGEVGWPVGTEITMTFTPSELEWLRGQRELS